MEFHKLMLITLMVLLVLLLWPQARTKFYINQMEHNLILRAKIRIASEDAIRVMKSSSYAYGDVKERINQYDTLLTIDTFFKSLKENAKDEKVIFNKSIDAVIPIIVAFEPSGYVLNLDSDLLIANEVIPVLGIESSSATVGRGRINLPIRRYMIEDEKAYYYLDFGNVITAINKDMPVAEHIELLSREREDTTQYFQSELDQAIIKIQQDTNLAEAFPLLKYAESATHLKFMFMESSFEAISNTVKTFDGFERVGYKNPIYDVKMIESFEFTGMIIFMSKDQFGSKAIDLEVIDCLQFIEPRIDVIGYLRGEIKVYCNEDCNKSQETQQIAIFPDSKTAAEMGYYPCELFFTETKF